MTSQIALALIYIQNNITREPDTKGGNGISLLLRASKSMI